MEKALTWPKNLLIIIFGVCIAFFGIMVVFIKFGKNDLHLPKLNGTESFAEGSVYRFLLSENRTGKVVAIATVLLQTFTFYFFLRASDYKSELSEYAFLFRCPPDSLMCNQSRQITVTIWILVTVIIILFVLGDLVGSFKIIYESMTSRSVQKLISGLVLLFITTLAIMTSFIYTYITTTTAVGALKDAAVLLFLNELDEKLYNAIRKISLSWIESIENEITSTIEATMVSTSQHEMYSAQNQNENIDIENEDTNADVMVPESNYGENRIEIDRLNSDIQNIFSVLRGLQNNYDRREKENNALKTELQNIKQECMIQQRAYEEQRIAYDEQKLAYAKLEDNMKLLKSEFHTMNQYYERQKSDNLTFKSECQQLKQFYNELKTEHMSLKSHYQQILLTCNQLGKKLSDDKNQLQENLGHPSEELTVVMAKRVGIKLKRKKSRVISCALAKAKRKATKKRNDKRSSTLGKRLYPDISFVKA